MKKQKILKFSLLGILSFYIVYVVISCLIYPMNQKKPTGIGIDSYKESLNYQTLNERVLSINSNQEALLYRINMISAAKEEIVLSTFDFRIDNSGKDVLSALYDASLRGVKIKIIVDGINAAMYLKNDKLFKKFASSKNIEIKFYNPVNLAIAYKNNFRLHDKYLIIDNTMYLMGGRNTNDLFLGNYQTKTNIDKEVLVFNQNNDDFKSLNSLKAYFEEIWNHKDSKIYKKRNSKNNDELIQHYEQLKTKLPEAFEKIDYYNLTVETNHISLINNPINTSNKTPEMWDTLNYIMSNAENILIQTPYIIMNKSMYSDVEDLTKSGKKINILTNSITSGANPLGCVDYLNSEKHILTTGVGIYELQYAKSLHTKTILIDDNISIIGSYNLDIRSTYLDTELMLVIDSPKLNESLKEDVKTYLESSLYVKQGEQNIKGSNYEENKLSGFKTFVYFFINLFIKYIRHLI